MKTERLQELKKLCDEATPGPWVYSEILASDEPTLDGVDVAIEDEGVICSMDYEQPRNGDWRATAEFIAASRTALPELIAEVERLKHEVALRDYEIMSYCKFGVPAQNKEVDRLRKQLARCKEQRNQFRNSLSNSFNVIPSIKSLDAELAKLEE